MRHIDLFSGIGGFALAAREVWGEEYENVCFCEINKYAQAVLRKNFGKDSVIIDDIRSLKAEQFGVVTSADRCGRIHGKSKIKPTKGSYKAQREPIASVESSCVSSLNTNGIGRNVSKCDRKEGQVLSPEKWKDEEDQRKRSGRIDRTSEGNRIDLLTGGFPCQPFSQAGKRKGTSDERHLWPEMLRVIREFRPTWVVAENVRGLLTIDGGLVFENCCADLEREGYEVQPFVIPACAVGAPHRRDRVWIVAHSNDGRPSFEEFQTAGNQQCDRGIDPHASEPRGKRREHSQCGARISGWSDTGEWNQNWLTPATEFCGIFNGLSDFMDRCFSKIIGDEDYGRTSEKDRTKGVSILREALQQKSIWKRIGGVLKISEKKVLLSFLLHVENQSIGSCKPVEGEESSSHQAMRRMWSGATFASSPQGRKSSKQQAVQLTSVVPELSFEVAFFLSESWRKVACAYASIESPAVEMDGTTLTKARHRVERLKALGNAIVPQVAVQLFRGLRLAEFMESI